MKREFTEQETSIEMLYHLSSNQGNAPQSHEELVSTTHQILLDIEMKG